MSDKGRLMHDLRTETGSMKSSATIRNCEAQSGSGAGRKYHSSKVFGVRSAKANMLVLSPPRSRQADMAAPRSR